MKLFLPALGALALGGAAVAALTRPRQETAENRVPIGGMVVSDAFDYRAQSDPRLAYDPLVKLLQLMWIKTAQSDAANHATQTPPEGVREINNLSYLPDGSRYHRLDVYYPDTGAEKFPVIVDIHGGGWMYGDKELNKLYCLALAARGYLVFNLSYPLVPDVTVPVQLRDLSYGLQWIRDHLADFPADAADLTLTGDSAGGMLAAYLSVLGASAELREIFSTVDYGLQFRGLLLTSPVAYMRRPGPMGLYTDKMWGPDRAKEPTAPYRNFNAILPFASLPPTCLITSAGDVIAHDQTVEACRDLTAHGTVCKLLDFGGDAGKKLPHVFTVLNPYNDVGSQAIDEALTWLREQ